MSLAPPRETLLEHDERKEKKNMQYEREVGLTGIKKNSFKTKGD